MNDKTKRIILITACCLLCGVAVIGIAGRFGGNTVTPSGTVSGSQPDSNDPNVNINNNLIKFPQRGVCLYKCGNERYLLEVHAPAYKEKLFGTAGGR